MNKTLVGWFLLIMGAIFGIGALLKGVQTTSTTGTDAKLNALDNRISWALGMVLVSIALVVFTFNE